MAGDGLLGDVVTGKPTKMPDLPGHALATCHYGALAPLVVMSVPYRLSQCVCGKDRKSLVIRNLCLIDIVGTSEANYHVELFSVSD
jgi:hypothetical protein